MKRNIFTIISESSLYETYNYDDAEEDKIEQDLIDELEDPEVEEIEECSLTAESVRLEARQNYDSTFYVLEADELAKYVDSAEEPSIGKAIEDIAKENGIEMKSLVVLFNPDEETEEYVNEAKAAKKAGNKKKLKNIAKVTKMIKELKAKGIKIAKAKKKKKK